MRGSLAVLKAAAVQIMAAFGANLAWERPKVRRKLLPLLLEWDASHPGSVQPTVTIVAMCCLVMVVSPWLLLCCKHEGPATFSGLQ